MFLAVFETNVTNLKSIFISKRSEWSGSNKHKFVCFNFIFCLHFVNHPTFFLLVIGYRRDCTLSPISFLSFFIIFCSVFRIFLFILFFSFHFIFLRLHLFLVSMSFSSDIVHFERFVATFGLYFCSNKTSQCFNEWNGTCTDFIL